MAEDQGWSSFGGWELLGPAGWEEQTDSSWRPVLRWWWLPAAACKKGALMARSLPRVDQAVVVGLLLDASQVLWDKDRSCLGGLANSHMA